MAPKAKAPAKKKATPKKVNNVHLSGVHADLHKRELRALLSGREFAGSCQKQMSAVLVESIYVGLF